MLDKKLLSDTELEYMLSDQSYLQAAIAVESALVAAQADCGEVPVDIATAIEQALSKVNIKAEDLLDAAAIDGVFIPAMLTKLRAQLPAEEADYLHRGATSQDIIDTASILILKNALQLIADRMLRVGNKLAALAETHSATCMLSRTRMQQAGLTTFGYKAACWLAPYSRHRQRLQELQSRLYCLSLGGASGTQAALGPAAGKIEEKMSARLGLQVATAPWHTQRDNIIEVGNWLALLAGSSAKIAGDIILMTQSEVAELRDQGGGGSSTLPQKSNPVRAEAIISLATQAQTQLLSLHQAALHQHERGGSAWQLEWLALPQILMASGACLRLLEAILDSLSVNTTSMQANIQKTQGRVFAEAATFLLAEKISLREARRIVSEACKSMTAGEHLFDYLQLHCPHDIDWQLQNDAARHLGQAESLTGKIVDSWRNQS